MSWSVDFAPLLPGPFFWAIGALALVLIGLLLWRSRGARCCVPVPWRH